MKRVCLAAIVVCAIVTLFIPLAFAEDLPEIKFEKYELPNGLDVILHEDHTIPIVSVNIWYHVGSKNESRGRTGFAHLFEHLMFEGSEHHNAPFTDAITKYGGDRNGSTNCDRTNYWEVMPSQHLERMLWLEADRMGNLVPAIVQERLDLQRSVVMNEKRQNTDDQPYGMVDEITRKLMYPKEHPYSWTTIGLMEDLESASLEDVHAFNRQFYRPNNASLCIAGDFDPEQAKVWVQKYFGPLEPGVPIDRMKSWVPVLTDEIRCTIEDEVRLPRVYLTWHTPPYYAPGDAEFDLFASVLAAGKSSRLYKSLVYDKQIAQDVAAYQSSREIASTFHITATVKPGHTPEEVEAEIDRILNEVLASGITQEEFDRVTANWESGFVRQLQTMGGFGGLADQLNGYNTYLGDPGMLKWDQERYTKTTIPEVLKYAREYLKPKARLSMYVVPQGQLAETDDATDMNIVPGPTAEPSFTPPNIEHASLSNGMELYVVQNHKLPLIQANLYIMSGWAADPSDRPGASAITAAMLNEGTKSRTALDISEEVQRLGIGLGVGSGFDNSSVNLNTLKEHLDEGLDLMADIVLNPTFPEDELQRQKQIYLGRIQQESAQAFTVAFKAFFRELFGEDHPYGQPYTGSGTEASITAITRADLQKYYKANYLPNNAVAVVTGDITLKDAKSKLEKAFKNWKSGPKPTQTIAEVDPPSKVKICIIDQPGTTQSAIVLGNLVGPRSDPDYLKATLVSQVLGGGSSARLYRNLREDKGFTYGSYSFVTGRLGQGVFAAYAQVQTEVTKEAIQEFMNEFRGICGDIPVSEQELLDNKNNLVKGYPQNFETITGVAGQLGTTVTYGLPLDRWKTYVDDINGIDHSQFLAAARKFVKPDELLIVVAGDRDKIEPKIRELGLGEIYFAGADQGQSDTY